MLKAVIGEYGKIIVLTVIACILILFMLGGGGKGLEEILKSTGPKATVGHGDSHELADDIASRNIPVLAVTAKKLKKGMKYNLLHAEAFGIQAENEDGDVLPVSVTKIISPLEEDITATADPQNFIPTQSGIYKIRYSTEENYLGSIKRNEKEYRFVAD